MKKRKRPKIRPVKKKVKPFPKEDPPVRTCSSCAVDSTKAETDITPVRLSGEKTTWYCQRCLYDIAVYFSTYRPKSVPKRKPRRRPRVRRRYTQ